ncbi:MAG: hypothetical protein QOF14_5207 [Hyphomicrobiales bacterium]|jgi:hypothetical protein|nr:hypothetical protein [Hyphomicrobiales bacterium]
MRATLPALAFACALLTSVAGAEPAARVAQMSRDVTDAVRKQRAEKHERPCAPCGCTREGHR